MLLGSRGARMPSEDATGRSAQATLEAPRAPGLLARGGASSRDPALPHLHLIVRLRSGVLESVPPCRPDPMWSARGN